MKTMQIVLRELIKNEEINSLSEFVANDNFLCLVFFGKDQSLLQQQLNLLSDKFPKGSFVGCSSAGHVAAGLVYDHEIVLTFIIFSKVNFLVSIFENLCPDQSEMIGLKIAKSIPENHHSALVLSEGLNVNGSRLVEGLKKERSDVNYFGGLSGDGYDFKETFVLKDRNLYNNSIILVSFDQNLKVKSSVGGGWSTFGIERVVTKSKNNIVYEIDQKAAIDLYDDFLGEKKVLLPSYGLHFPIFLESEKIVRTLLAVDRENKSLTFAGDVPEMSKIKLMRSSPESLITYSVCTFCSKIVKFIDSK